MISQRVIFTLCLLVMGVSWGLTIPLTKLAVSEGYQEFGLIFWQQMICVGILGLVVCLRRQRLPFGRVHLKVYTIIAIFGTVLPNTASYTAAVHLPAGVLSILISTVPMFAFPIALLFGIERFSWRRVAGLCLGLVAILLLVGPEASLPDRMAVMFIPIALIAPVFYAFESNYVAKWGVGGLDPVQALLGASLVGSAIGLVLALASGQFIDPRGPWGGRIMRSS
jgi:drug/metabolite transporter (DMT)-like permease